MSPCFQLSSKFSYFFPIACVLYLYIVHTYLPVCGSSGLIGPMISNLELKPLGRRQVVAVPAANCHGFDVYVYIVIELQVNSQAIFRMRIVRWQRASRNDEGEESFYICTPLHTKKINGSSAWTGMTGWPT